MRKRKVTAATPSGMANPFLDVVFKTIFDERTTLEFLNSILKPERPIVEVRFENSESNDTSIYGMRVYFDVLCTDDIGRKFIVEMQNSGRQCRVLRKSINFDATNIREYDFRRCTHSRH